MEFSLVCAAGALTRPTKKYLFQGKWFTLRTIFNKHTLS